MKTQDPKLLTIGLTIFLSSLGILAARTQGYVSMPEYDEATQALQSRFIQHIENSTLFYTKVILNRQLAQVTLPFKLPNPDQIIYLAFVTDDEYRRDEYMVYHPQLQNLSWQYIESSDQLRLYQKTPTYQTIDDFLQNPPPANQVAADLLLTTKYPQLNQSTTLGKLIDLNTTDYILTRHKPPLKQSDTYLYQNTINTQQARLNTHNEIQWIVKTPLATAENPYLLGNIHVEFIQQ